VPCFTLAGCAHPRRPCIMNELCDVGRRLNPPAPLRIRIKQQFRPMAHRRPGRGLVGTWGPHGGEAKRWWRAGAPEDLGCRGLADASREVAPRHTPPGFFETFLLAAPFAGYTPATPLRSYCSNSYYGNAIGAAIPSGTGVCSAARLIARAVIRCAGRSECRR